MTTPASIRRDPSNTGKGFSKTRGFTIIEFMIVIAVVAIITSLALPSYRTVLEKRQVTSGAEQLSAFLGLAQLEAVKRNQFVAVNYQQSGGDWCLGMRAGNLPSTSCDCTVADPSNANACALDGALKVFSSTILNYPDVLQSAAVGDDGTVVFDPTRGLLQGAETVKLGLISDASSYALDVEVAVTGRVKICSNKAADKDVPGYKECSA